MAHDSPPEFADVSVIIAAYQAASTVARALQSIASQTLKPREAVVVDDGSSDGTAEAAEAEGPQMNGIKLLVFRTEDNRGAGAARNRAIEESTQPFLAFLDADDEWLPEKMACSMSYLKDSEYILVAHDYVTGEGDRTRHHHCERRFLEDGDAFVNLYRKGYIPSCSVVAHRDAVLAAGGFDPGLPNAQDFDLWLAMTRETDKQFLVFGEPLLWYHPGRGGIMSHTDRRLRCGLEIAVRYFPDLKTRPGSALMSLWFRIAALHMEAICAHAGCGNITGAFLAAGLFPFRWLAATINCLLWRPQQRRSFLG